MSVRLFPENLRVLEVAEAMAGPYCGMLLGDFGADVIKIERPKVGDQSRNWGPPFVGTESTYFLAINRNKRSLTLNLNHPRGLEILEKLVLAADVFIINQPSYASLAKRGMHYEALSTLNPRLIYCSITGYGFTGPKVNDGDELLPLCERFTRREQCRPDGGRQRDGRGSQCKTFHSVISSLD